MPEFVVVFAGSIFGSAWRGLRVVAATRRVEHTATERTNHQMNCADTFLLMVCLTGK
jgi:hypothetical protein